MTKQYDLEDRTQQYAADVRIFVRGIQLDLPNKEDARQLIRSSGSVAANYIEANESLSRKDFGYRIKICRKEVKESKLWLILLMVDKDQAQEKTRLINEATELLKIFSSILSKSGLNEPEVNYERFDMEV